MGLAAETVIRITIWVEVEAWVNFGMGWAEREVFSA